MNDKIRDLQKQIETEKTKMSRCNHDFDKPFSNPEDKLEPYGCQTIARGGDVWHEPEGFRHVDVPRWTRKCKLCGFEEHAYSQKPIVSGYEPDFKNN